MKVDDADSFYSTMGMVTQDLLEKKIVNADSLIKVGSTYNTEISAVTAFGESQRAKRRLGWGEQ